MSRLGQINPQIRPQIRPPRQSPRAEGIRQQIDDVGNLIYTVRDRLESGGSSCKPIVAAYMKAESVQGAAESSFALFASEVNENDKGKMQANREALEKVADEVRTSCICKVPFCWRGSLSGTKIRGRRRKAKR